MIDFENDRAVNWPEVQRQLFCVNQLAQGPQELQHIGHHLDADQNRRQHNGGGAGFTDTAGKLAGAVCAGAKADPTKKAVVKTIVTSARHMNFP
ncbi:MAG: hypothetical protein I8H91_13160 [Burkholderiales bacterium]|nr:hypothetical protein [Burkholderiales bacterium]